MKPSLQIKLSQHLALTPQLQQSIRLLQLSTLELHQEIEQALQDNPLLERIDEADGFAAGVGDEAGQRADNNLYGAGQDLPVMQRVEANEARDSDTAGDLKEFSWNADGGAELTTAPHGLRDVNDDNESGVYDTQAAITRLADHLIAQLALSQLTPSLRALAAFIVEGLDEDGYLAQSLEDLADVLPEDLYPDRETLLEELTIALRHVQSLDPSGVGARDARECLLLQLQALPDSPTRHCAQLIISSHLPQLAQRDFARIKKSLGCTDADLRTAHALILGLNPRPGARFAAEETRYIVPDVVVKKQRGQWLAQLNADAMPRLRVNRLYADLLKKSRANGGNNLVGQLQEAKWLIKNVQQRFDTILRVSQAILERQCGFFEHGEVAMRPLTLREIAEMVELHESTISRVTTQKYLACPRGVFELKYFFGSHVATETGGEASSIAIRALIKQLVAAENGKQPLADARIAAILGEQGFVVARRTVAKYREALNIPPVSLRRQF